MEQRHTLWMRPMIDSGQRVVCLLDWLLHAGSEVNTVFLWCSSDRTRINAAWPWQAQVTCWWTTIKEASL